VENKSERIFIVLPNQIDEIRGHIVVQLVADLMAMQLYEIDYHLYTTESTLLAIKNEIISLGVINKFIDTRSHIGSKNFNSTIDTIIDTIKNSSEKDLRNQIYFPWWDLIPLDNLEKFESELVTNSIKWSTIAHVSTHLRVSKLSRETSFLEYAAKSMALNKVFYWDSLPETSFEKNFRSFVVKLPEFHFYTRKNDSIHSLRRLRIGFFGRQSIARGKLIFLWLALINPTIKFVGVGDFIESDLYFRRLILIPLLGSKLNFVLRKFIMRLKPWIKNYSESYLYFNNQREFNQSLIDFNAIFVAGHLLPYSSGVALQSLACGVPVIWTSGNSAHSDQMKKHFPIGRLRIVDRFIPFVFYFKVKKIILFSNPIPTVEFNSFASTFITKLLSFN